MCITRLNALVILLITFACDDQTPPRQQERWRLTEYTAKTTSCCFSFDEDGNLGDGHQAHPIFDVLMGLEDERTTETILILREPHSFSILKDDSPVIAGSMYNDRQQLQLVYQQHHLELRIIRKTTDSLVMEAKGFDCGPMDVVMTFVAASNE